MNWNREHLEAGGIIDKALHKIKGEDQGWCSKGEATERHLGFERWIEMDLLLGRECGHVHGLLLMKAYQHLW